MKRISVYLLVAFALALPSRSFALFGVGDIVFDPSAVAEAAANHAENMLQWADDAAKQLQQIEHLITQVEQMEAYIEIFGDPEKVAELIGIGDEIKFFEKLSEVEDFEDLRNAMEGADSVDWDWNGVFVPDEVMKDVNAIGEAIEREKDHYKKYGIIEGAIEGYEEAVNEASEDRGDILDQVNQTLDQIKNADNQAEVEKLKAVVQAQEILLAEERARVDEQAQKVLVANAAREMQEAKVEQARQEEVQSLMGKDGDAQEFIDRERPEYRRYSGAKMVTWDQLQRD
mgnify:CR=1 FL=1